ncbi:MAG: glutathione S-transferase family protein [Elainellaceae cyanobacterium]
MLKVYGDLKSGNCYKIKLLLYQRAIAHEWIPIDILKGETRTETFLAKNPNGKIPTLELEDGRYLSESNAILFYLAEQTQFLPDEPYDKAKVMQWLFFEQYSHEPYIAVSRFIIKYLNQAEAQKDTLLAKQTKGYSALNVMDQQLQQTPFLVGQHYTIADIALYAYTHVAHEGGFDLVRFPALQSWLDRVAHQPNHISMQDAEKCS